MDTDVIKELHIGLIGRPVEVGIYAKDGDEWVGTDAGVLTSYTLTPEKNGVTIARSSQEATSSVWDPAVHYILLTVIK